PEFKKKYIDTGKVRFIMREFPLDNLAAAAAMLARCTGDNDKSVALANVLFKKRSDWVVRGNPVPRLFEIAKQAGFTETSFNACLQDQALLDKIARGRDKASKDFNVNATPTFFINGKRLTGRTDQLSTFDEALAPLLKSS
ncbi:MAG: thioredoxin domain-containing protein, partial [Pseudomonadota bacterium]